MKLCGILKRAILLLVIGFLPMGCNRPNAPTEPEAVDPLDKDLVTFRLPAEVESVAPDMQTHLYRTMIYLSPRHAVKPEYVFAEGPDPDVMEMVKGPGNITVKRMNLIHMAYYRDGRHVWSGSVLKGVNIGCDILASTGYRIRLGRDEDHVAFTFTDGELSFSDRFNGDEDYQTWLEQGSVRLYINQYVFPASLSKTEKPYNIPPASQPGERK